VRPVHFQVVEVLEEVDDRDRGIHQVGDQNSRVAAPLASVAYLSQGNSRDRQHEDGRQPDEPVRLELLGCPLELLVRDVPLQIDQPPRDLSAESTNEGPEEPALSPGHLNEQSASLASHLDTVTYPDAVMYANGEYMSAGKRLSRGEKQAATRAALVESAADVFTRRGYEAASVEEISEAAGFSRGAFYSNYESKEELFLTLIESRIQGRLEEIASAFQLGDTAEDRIRSGGRHLDSLVAQDRQWCLLYMEFWARAVRDPKLRKRFAAQYEAWRTGIAYIIETQSDELGVTLDASPHELASALIALFEGHVLQKLIDPKGLEEGFFVRLLLRFFGRFGAFNEVKVG
jgi:AcrR family transcriptional regulator